MGRLVTLFWLLVILFQGHLSQSQPHKLLEKRIVFEQLPAELGLGQRTINDIAQDSEGYIWVATWSGLIRYDGRSSKIFLVGDGPTDLKSNKITSITESKDGNLWIGTRAQGLYLYDKSRDEFISYLTKYPELKPFKNVWDIQLDNEGNPWLATEKGLVSITNDKVSVYTKKQGLSFDFITGIYSDNNGRFWLTTENGLNYFDPQHPAAVKQYYYGAPNSSDYALHNYLYDVVSVQHEGAEKIFAISKKGLKELKDGVLINRLTNFKETGYNFFRTLVAVQDNKPLLIIGSETGLNVYDVAEEKFRLFLGDFNNANLSHNTITSIFIDRTGVLWVGTKKGLNKFDTYDKGFKLFRNKLFDPRESIITGLSGVDNDVLISTIGGGLFHFDTQSETFQKVEIEVDTENDFTDYIQKLFIDYDQNVYLGTAGNGIYRFRLDDINSTGYQITNYDNFSTSNGFVDDYIMSFGSSNDGGVWVGSWSGGLSKVYANKQVKTFDHPILFEAPIVEVFQSKNTLWVGSRGNGLYQFEVNADQLELKKVFSSFSEHKLSSDFVSVILEDDKGRIWVGTENGLDQYMENCDCFKVFGKQDGRLTNEVISMLNDEDGNLWLANWSGISVILVEEDVQLISHFDRSDRLQGEFFYNDVAYKSETGLLYFGGSNGFNIIDPGSFITNPHQPAATISSIKIFDTELKPAEPYNNREILTTRIEQTEAIQLEPYENSIELEFSAMHFAHPSKNRFQYKLEGFDQTWHETNQARPFATYTNLPHGDYKFLLRASNNDGLWQEEPLLLNIEILPPWWKTPWAVVVFGVAIILLLFAFRALIIMRTSYENDLKLAEVERKNLEKTNRAKLKFFTNVSHEFRTPLTLILGPIENLLETSSTDRYVKDQLHTVKRNASRLLKLVNQLLDFRKVESGNLKLRVAEGDFIKFVKEIKLSFDSRAEELGISFNMHSSTNVVSLYFDRDQFEKIIYNLLSNSFKHTPRGGQVNIKVIERKEDVELIVEDNGEGIPKDKFGMIFNRFYSEDHDFEGTGIGLALVKSLVKKHHAEISFTSIEREKTAFKITLKKGKDHFADDEILTDFQDSEQIGKYVNDDFALDEEPVEPPVVDIADLEKLMVVEDNKDVRAFIKSIFLGQYVILEAKNGEEALHLATSEIPDIIISDVMMPVMDGITLCKNLKTNRLTSHIPVILLTARTSLIFETEGYESGADDFVSKPFSSSLLKIRVKNLVEQRKRLKTLYSQGKGVNLEPSLVSFTSADELFMKSALDSVEKNMSNSEYSVEDLGKDVGLSRMQLYRKLKAMLGMSANEFIRTIRLKRSAQLLKTNNYTISEVTYMCGFTDLQYFRKCFKALFKVNPSEYHLHTEDEISAESNN